MAARANTPTEFGLSHPLPPQHVVLQVDAARQHDYWRWLMLGLALLAAALFDGSQRSAPRSHGYRLEELQRARAAEEARGRVLQLEIASLRSPALIEALAVQKIHLVPPGRYDQIVIERVVPPEPPPASIVASR
jgi:hypothetical protein